MLRAGDDTADFAANEPGGVGAGRPPEHFSWQRIDGTQLYIDDGTAAACRLTREVIRQAGPRPRVLIAPYLPGLYAIFRLKCPIFESYPLYPPPGPSQLQDIADLQSAATRNG